MQLDPEAYNSAGERLTNDRKQSRYVMLGLVFAAFASILFLLWMIFWQPIKG